MSFSADSFFYLMHGVLKMRRLMLATLGVLLLCSPSIYAQWTLTARLGLGSDPITCMAVYHGNLFVGLAGGPVLASSDSGTSWANIECGISPSGFLEAIEVFHDYLFVASSSDGVLRLSGN